jgi:small conductance mechanosensitive channel
MLNTPDKISNNPNGPLSTGALINYSAEPLQSRLDFWNCYGDDVEDFKRAMNDFIAADNRILAEILPFYGTLTIGRQFCKFAVRVWVDGPDY